MKNGANSLRNASYCPPIVKDKRLYVIGPKAPIELTNSCITSRDCYVGFYIPKSNC